MNIELSEETKASILKEALAGMLGSTGQGAQGIPKGSTIQIAILEKGFVFVGKCYYSGPFLHIEDAKCIRVWGTTRGLGEIAVNGPTDKTVLDPVPGVTAGAGSVVALIPCEASKWV